MMDNIQKAMKKKIKEQMRADLEITEMESGIKERIQSKLKNLFIKKKNSGESILKEGGEDEEVEHTTI